MNNESALTMEAREKYLQLHLNPENQAVALADHYLAMAGLAHNFHELVKEWRIVRLRPRKHKGKSVAQISIEKEIEKVVDHIKAQHLKHLGLPLHWTRILNTQP
jgi:hypothetical protein